MGRKSNAAVITPEVIADEAKAPRRMADVLRAHRSDYQATKAYSGKHSLHNGDPVAQALAGATPAQAIAAAQALADKADPENDLDLAAKYAKLNVGQQRMNAGNRIRGFIKRGEATIDEALAAIAAS